MKSAGHGCLATTANPMGAQATAHFGKMEKAVLVAACERPHEMHKGQKKDKSTKERKQGAKYVIISLNFF